MSRIRHRGTEEARNQFSDLLAAAESGEPTIITKHGRPIAALVPVDQYDRTGGQQSLLALKGTGRGLWGSRSSSTIRKLRDEWTR
jgi:prevent-host-death family protein